MKKYVKPENHVVNVETESVLNSFSTGGTIEGPFGSKRRSSYYDWEEEDF